MLEPQLYVIFKLSKMLIFKAARATLLKAVIEMKMANSIFLLGSCILNSIREEMKRTSLSKKFRHSNFPYYTRPIYVNIEASSNCVHKLNNCYAYVYVFVPILFKKI